jgi:succinoglycan biosynthesis transport protein ExoP
MPTFRAEAYDSIACGVRHVYALSGGIAKSPDSLDSNEFKLFFATLYARRWLVLAVLLAFVGATFAITLTTPKHYSTQAKLLTGANGPGASGADANSPLSGVFASNGRSPETYADLLQETPIAERVAKNLKLPIDPTALLAHLVVTPLSNTQIIMLTTDWRDPVTAAALANEFMRVFVVQQRELVSSQAISTIDFLNREMPAAEARMHHTNAILAEYSAAHRIVDINSQTQTFISELAANDTKTAQTKLDLKQWRAQLADIDGQITSFGPQAPGGETHQENPLVTQLQSQLEQVTVQLKTQRKQFTAEYPAVKALEDQRAQIVAELAKLPPTVVSSENVVPNPIYGQLRMQMTQLRSQIAAGEAELVELGRQHASLLPALAHLPAQATRLADLQREAKSSQDIYNALQQKFAEASVVHTTAPSDVTIIQPADASRAAVTPNVQLNVLIGSIIGLVVALGSAFVANLFDNTVKTEVDVADRLKLPTLATIPVIARTDGTTEIGTRLKNIRVEAFLHLVTSLQYSSDTTLRTISFTSPTPGDGKSTISLHAAIAMAELQPPVLIVDADLRRPTLHTKLNMSNGIGLSDMLVGRMTFDEVVQQTPFAGLHFVASGIQAPNPVKLLRSKRMDDFLADVSRRYTCVFVDAPAANVVVDGLVIATKTDGSILVVSAGQTELPQTLKALDLLQRFGVTNLLGVVLNRVKSRNSIYMSYYMDLSGEALAADTAAGANVALTTTEE